ncbi:MAG: magnesium transporter [Candidatus Aenigmarchaeota archaeon]|nr:magnesium transporter [Candidatus Aenigmarchaeota archaeon]
MRIPKIHIRKIQKLKRRSFHVVQHRIHKKHKLSYRTMYYIKSYGQDRHVWHAIVKQSFFVVLFASVISTLGGLWLQSLQAKLTVLLPLLIMVPALNTMIGNFGTIVGAKFSTYLFTGKVRGQWWKSEKIHELTATIFAVALIAAFYISAMASFVAILNSFYISVEFFVKLLLLSVVCTLLLGALITIISFAGGYLIFRRGDDPNNFLIPLTTAIADLGSLTIFAFIVVSLF